MNELIKQCKCGEIIRASTQSQLKYNFKSHQEGFKHKERLSLIKRLPKENSIETIKEAVK